VINSHRTSAFARWRAVDHGGSGWAGPAGRSGHPRPRPAGRPPRFAGAFAGVPVAGPRVPRPPGPRATVPRLAVPLTLPGDQQPL